MNDIKSRWKLYSPRLRSAWRWGWAAASPPLWAQGRRGCGEPTCLSQVPSAQGTCSWGQRFSFSERVKFSQRLAASMARPQHGHPSRLKHAGLNKFWESVIF